MSKPSILFITTDEQHLDTVYRNDLPYSLPGLQTLMECSDIYENVYSASPVCLPARCSWMTGLMPHKNGNISNIFGASLSLNLPNLFTLLSRSGYTTSMHGKCHFIPCPYPATRSDLTQDYAHYISYYQQLGMDHLDLQDDKNISMWYYDHYAMEMEREQKLAPYRQRFMSEKAVGWLPDYPCEKESHPDSWTGRKALDYLDRCSGDQPHFMWVSFSGPHYPMDAPGEYCDQVNIDKDFPRRWREGEWDDPSKHNRMGYWGTGPGTEGSSHAPNQAQKNYTEDYWREWRRKYYGNIVQIDSYIEKIIAKALNIWKENLYIVFSSDHGDMMGNHSEWGKNCSLYNDVLRVPLIIHHPGQSRQKRISPMVSSVDVFPTILRMAGCGIPAEIDGIPLEDVVEAGGRDFVISSCEGRVALIKGNLKLCYNGGGFGFEADSQIYKELYDLENDPFEFVNLYGNPDYAEQQQQLEKLLTEEPYLLRSVFWKPSDKPYWLDDGSGTGYRFNKL